ncbi:MAG: uroporphyrinogen-III synthase [Pseudohongiellaceae bacterium]
MGKKTITAMSGPVASQLEGCAVLVTRPIGQQAELIAKLEALGAAVVSKPMLRIEGLTDAGSINSLKSKIQNLAEYDVAIFISTNAARFGGAWIDQYWPQFPQKLTVIAIGSSTARSLHEKILCPVVQPTKGSTSEDVLALPELSNIAGKRVVIFRGIGGRELLATELKTRGAKVDYLEVYSRHSLEVDSNDFYAELREEGVNILSANSSETATLLKNGLGKHFSGVSEMPLLVPSARVAQQARKMGFSKAVNCEGADPDAFVAALLKIADTV